MLTALHFDLADALLVLVQLVSQHLGTQVLLLQHKVDLVVARVQITEELDWKGGLGHVRRNWRLLTLVKLLLLGLSLAAGYLRLGRCW